MSPYKIFALPLLGFSTLLALPGSAETLLSGGSTTVFQEGPNAFAMPLANITRANRRAHVVGNSFFNKNWVLSPSSTSARDGLGPLYHARSCSACHVRDGRGSPTKDGRTGIGLLFRLSIPAKTGGDPNLGLQLAVNATPGTEPEGKVEIIYEMVRENLEGTGAISLRRPEYKLHANPIYGDTHPETRLSPRLAQPLVGLGLLEAVEEKTILALADPNDANKDGVSGRARYVLNPENQQTELGRFGWKASQPSLRLQTAVAFHRDIGITSNIHPEEDFTISQARIIKPVPRGEPPEIDDMKLGRVVTYLRTLAPPAQRNLKDQGVVKGEQIFTRAGCAMCHTPVLKTGPNAYIDELKNQLIRPYTDLLLHDMGDALSDRIDKEGVSGREWRTPPLWGIGLTKTVNGNTFYLHDGRARTLEEAIMWHGGEGLDAKKAYANLPETQRALLLQFLHSL